jgi:hypothetical protein
VCDKGDKIVDYNSLENDIIKGNCEYEDKGLIKPEPIPDKEIPEPTPAEKNRPSLFPNSAMPSRGNNNDNTNFEKVISKLFDIDIPRIFP